MENLLPQGWDIQVQNIQVEERSSLQGMTTFQTRITMKGCEDVNFSSFLEDFYKSSGTQFNIFRGDNIKTAKAVVTGFRKCIRNTRTKIEKYTDEVNPAQGTFARKGIKPNSQSGAERRPGLHTKCDASLKFKVKKCRADGDHSECRSLEIDLNWRHNHRTAECLDAGRYKTINKEVEDIFNAFFEAGHYGV